METTLFSANNVDSSTIVSEESVDLGSELVMLEDVTLRQVGGGMVVTQFF
jgi:hypothetical protein